MFVIEDDLHGDQIGRFARREEALAELRRLAATAWDVPPNRAPCTAWRTCGRVYEIVEFDERVTPWREVSRTTVLKLSSVGCEWVSEAAC